MTQRCWKDFQKPVSKIFFKVNDIELQIVNCTKVLPKNRSKAGARGALVDYDGYYKGNSIYLVRLVYSHIINLVSDGKVRVGRICTVAAERQVEEYKLRLQKRVGAVAVYRLLRRGSIK